MARGILLFSGGLDSIVAAHLLTVQSLNVRLLTFLHPFIADLQAFEERVRARGAELHCEVDFARMGEDYLEVVRNPQSGYGKNLNPCVDCRIYQLRRAKGLLEELGAQFIATGEVVGQRPMSQRRRTLELIDRRAGVEGLVVRPLCAKLLAPSRAETEGIVDRERLMDIRGRSRRRQMELAREAGIGSYPTPAGGCLLTDAGFAARAREMMEHEGLSLEGIELLKVGRHFRVSEKCRVVVGRDREENDRLRIVVGKDDLLVEPVDFKGPDCIVRGEDSEEVRRTACGLAVRYSRYESGTCRISRGGAELVVMKGGGVDEETCDRLRIGRGAAGKATR
jgi:tRNA U34 2-thiouridine synthase MnmA/TrmU